MRNVLKPISILAAGLLASSAARADNCTPVEANIDTSFVACPADFPSPVGLCTAGAIDSGSGGAVDGGQVMFADVHMAFGDRLVFRKLSCTFPAGKISVILGGSGSGGGIAAVCAAVSAASRAASQLNSVAEELAPSAPASRSAGCNVPTRSR